MSWIIAGIYIGWALGYVTRDRIFLAGMSSGLVLWFIAHGELSALALGLVGFFVAGQEER